MKRRLCLFVVVLSLAQGLWSQTTPASLARSSLRKARFRNPRFKCGCGLPPGSSLSRTLQRIRSTSGRSPSEWVQAVIGRRLAVSAVTAGLVGADPYIAPYFRTTGSFHRFNSIATTNVSAIGAVIAPVGFYVIGMIRSDSYAKETALLAAEAIADAQILSLVMQTADRRIRPRNLPLTSNYRDTWFKNDVSLVGGNGSFPSGHTLTAFAVATVISRRYPQHRWIPYVVYGLAAIAGFSRITGSDHFTSDVFFGAAAGYSISRFSVLQR